jgi:tetraacyldisaccharide 4'-kinase
LTTFRRMGWLESLWYGRHPARWLLWPLSLAYGSIVALRRALYRHGVWRVKALPVPVVVLGNISVGGTGKTPAVIWLATQLGSRGFAVGVVSRGYGGQSHDWPRAVGANSDPREVGDEPVMIARRTGCPVVVGPDRVAACRALLAANPVDVLLADDGLQHYRLGRRVEIAVVDGERGLGNGLLLPAGPLREWPHRLAEVDAVLVNGGPGGGGSGLHARLRPRAMVRLDDGLERALDEFRGRRVHAVAGIGHPQRFFALLEAAGIEVVPHPLADHACMNLAEIPTGDPILMTEKDAIKYTGASRQDVWYLIVDLCFDEGDDREFLERVLAKLRA